MDWPDEGAVTMTMETKADCNCCAHGSVANVPKVAVATRTGRTEIQQCSTGRRGNGGNSGMIAKTEADRDGCAKVLGVNAVMDTVATGKSRTRGVSIWRVGSVRRFSKGIVTMRVITDREDDCCKDEPVTNAPMDTVRSCKSHVGGTDIR